MTDFQQQGPLQIIERIANGYLAGSNADFRAAVTVYTLSGSSYTGVPTSYMRDNQGDYFALTTKEKATIVMYSRGVAGVLVSDQNQMQAFLLRPWQTDSRFGSISKMQCARDTEAEFKELNMQVQFKIETFPTNDEYIFGATLAWLINIKSELKKIAEEFSGSLDGIKTLQIQFTSGKPEASKIEGGLSLSCDFKPESFSREKISELLRQAL